MSINGQGVSRKRRVLPKKQRPGWLQKMDQRSSLARFLHANLLAVSDQLGGLDELTPIARMLVTRLLHVDAMAADLEQKAHEGKVIDPILYLSVVDRNIRLGAALGLKRVSKQAETLAGYMAIAAQEPTPAPANGSEAIKGSAPHARAAPGASPGAKSRRGNAVKTGGSSAP